MADLDRLLERTSRTFALSIPLLPEPTRREVGIAYLLFRIADTFEDATLWKPARRVEALGEFTALLGDGGSRDEAAARRWTDPPPCAQEGYLELLRESPSVLADFRALSPAAAATIRGHVAASAEGMAGFVRRMSEGGDLRLADIADLRAYCYAVAGIVGEMLTDLFLLGRDALAATAPYLRERAARFGEALQLVNILKDAGSDQTEGRSYLPENVSREDVFALARRDLGDAGEYVLALQRAGAPQGLVGFTALPVELAWATLERVEKRGPGAKVPRTQVYRIVSRLKRDIERGRPAVHPRS